MFSKVSRYRKLPDDVTIDVKGRVLASKSIRLTPETTGTFEHIVEEGDRLDHLSFKYYKQPRTWWRIADANLDYHSPRALLGKSTVKTMQVELTWDDVAPPWPALRETLTAALGVEAVMLGTPDQPLPTGTPPTGAPDFTIASALVTAMRVLVRLQNVSETDPPELIAARNAIQAAFLAEAINLTDNLTVGKFDDAGWSLIDQTQLLVFTLQFLAETGVLSVHAGAPSYTWLLVLSFNTAVTDEATLAGLIEGLGFEAADFIEVGRVGKPIIVPPRKVM